MAHLEGQNTWRRLRNQLAVLALVVAGFLAVALTATRMAGDSIDQLATATATARLQANAALAIELALREAESGQRGYLLTARPYYLEPYYRVLGQIENLLAQLHHQAAGVPWLEQEYTALAAAAHNKLDELQRTVVTAQRDGLDAAIALVRSDEGLAYMNDARTVALRIADRAEAERTARAALLQSRQHLLGGTLLAALCIGFVLLGATVTVLLWISARLSRARAGEARQATRLRAAIEHVPDGVAVFNAEGCLTLSNTRFAAALALPTPLAAPGASLADIAASSALTPPVLDAATPREPTTTEARQAKRALEIWRSPMPGGGQILAIADVTRRNGAEEVARQAQKMDVLGQMTGGVAHDFNNLLQVVSANLELVRSKLDRAKFADPSVFARLDAANAGVARGARLTRHLLAFARRQPLAPEPIDAARLVMGMEDLLRRTVGESIALELVIGGGLWSMRADPNQCENALLNLALNARDAMTGPDGIPAGRLTIEAANAALDEAYAANAAEVTPGQYVMFAVTDTGTGMTAEQIARAVEPFYTTKPEGRGTGLGLPMVLGFAKQSGGHFQLYSEPGQGTTARLYIPRTTAALGTPAPETAGMPRGEAELVLLVEDDPAVRLAAREALHNLNYQVIEAETADAALAILEAGAKPQILFTDVVMPGKIPARDMAKRAETLVPGIAVLFTSGYTQNSIVHNGQLDADVTLISKPWRTGALARALRAVLARGPGRPAPQRRVLLVEDEELVRMTTADALAELGFDVLEAATAAAALARLHPPPDLLLTDLGLPDQDGLALAEEARRRIPGLPVVVVSGQSGPPAAEVVWLPKPYDLEALRKALKTALE